MKKIITLITMFVLSVGFLMAQGVFTYQAVVVDNDGNLVVDQTVNATVTIQSSGSTYTEVINGIHTDLDAMALLSIGSASDPNFMAIDWKTANIKVQFTPTGGGPAIPTAEYERVAGVPYAMQSADDILTTEMIADYYGRSTTTMDDMNAILAALESNTPLEEGFRQALIDSVIHNRLLAKEILLYWLNTGTPSDVQAMYNAFDGNTELKEAFMDFIKWILSDHNTRELMYYVLREYALALTSQEVNDLFDAIPNSVKQAVLTRGVEYLEDPAHKATLIIPVMMEYVSSVTTEEFTALVQALVNNVPVYTVMHNQFNEWMDKYFETRFSGGVAVKDLVASTIEDGYYADCNPEIDLCQLQTDLISLNTCFDLITTSPQFTKNSQDHYICSMTYTGTENPSSVSVHVEGSSSLTGDFDINTTATVNTTEKKISVDFTPAQISLLPGDTFNATFTIMANCPDSPITVNSTYVEP